MLPHKAKLIVNPNADLGRARHGAADLRPIVEEFGGADWTGTVYPTHAVELARQAAEQGYELVIAAGGDGTVHEVVNGLMQAPRRQRPRLGVVPLGSGNDFSHAIGFDTIVTIRSRRITLFSGFMIYRVAVFQTILFDHEAPRMQIATDQESWDEETLLFVMCNGGREGGGCMVQPQACPDDGLLHYAGVKRVSRPMMLRLVPEVMKGTHGRFRQVRMGTFHRLSLQADRPLYIHTDGEIFAGWGTDVRKLEVEIMPGEIEVVA